MEFLLLGSFGMIIRRLVLSNYRNYKKLELNLSPGINVLSGDNAQAYTPLSPSETNASRSASGQFKPFNPQAYLPLSPSEANAPRSASSQFKPLTPPSKPTSSLSGKSAPKFQWSKDFGQSESDASVSSGRMSALPSPEDPGSGSFKPGLLSSARLRKEAPRFQWDKLGNK